MDRIRFLFTFHGRVPRRTFAIATLALAAAGAATLALAARISGGSPLLLLAFAAAGLVLLASYGAFAVRRLHDLGCSGLWLWLAAFGLWGLSGDAILPQAWLLPAVVAVVAIPGLVVLAALLILPSQLGENDYGLDPLSGRALRLRRA